MENSRLSFKHAGYIGRIGAARTDITPPVGIYAKNWGAAVHDKAEGIHRPLSATAIAIDKDGRDPLVLLSLDLGWWRRRKDEWSLRKKLLETLHLTDSRVMINFTHTHSGPSICPEDSTKPGGDLIAGYMAMLSDRVISAVENAINSLEPAVLDWGYGKCGLAQNRDLEDPDSDRILCGFNTKITDPDDTLLVGRAADLEGRLLAVLVNYACHPTTLAYENRLISPDFPGAMREIIEQQTSALCLYLHGASGELAPREQYTADVATADRHGRELGYAVLSTIENMLPPSTQMEYSKVVESGAPLGQWGYRKSEPCKILHAVQDKIELTVDLPTAEMLKNEMDAAADPVLLERLNRKLRIREGIGDGEQADMPFWVWRIGDAIVLGHPNEAYSGLQIELRKSFPGVAVVVMNCVNGHYGYLPPSHLYAENIYPVWQTPFTKGCHEKMISKCRRTIEKMLETTSAS